MRIAFVSCICTTRFKDQPVWDWIAAQQPDRLLLLGDSLYLDVPLDGPHPRDMSDDGFAQHLHRRYTELIAQPQFAALVRALPAGAVNAIWDDHDFLWNDAEGAEAKATPLHREKVRLSTAFLETFREALRQRLAHGAFPDAYNDARFWDLAQPELKTPSLALAADVWLHLTDGRSHRTRTWPLPESRRTLLGLAQRQRLEAAVRAAPQALHLLASGSTLGAWKRHYARDWSWLLQLAKAHRLLVLSGDIHRNETDAYVKDGLPLHEATSSGAAVKDAVVVGTMRRNFGLLDIGPQQLTMRLFADNTEQTQWTRRLDRNTWLPA
jgi:alkaline phosphatase D